MFACVGLLFFVVFWFFSEGTCVGRAAGRAWHKDGQILNQDSAACACGRAGISAGKVTIGPELVFSQGCVSGRARKVGQEHCSGLAGAERRHRHIQPSPGSREEGSS